MSQEKWSYIHIYQQMTKDVPTNFTLFQQVTMDAQGSILLKWQHGQEAGQNGPTRDWGC